MTLLKIDVDMHPPKLWLQQWLDSRVFLLEELFKLTVLDTKVFKTKRGIHVYINVAQKLSDEDVNRLQFICGDDPVRVKINQMRIERGIKRWNKLFCKTYYRRKPKQVISCEVCGNKIPIFQA